MKRNALFRVKKGRTIHNLEFSTIWRILVDSEMNSHANPQEFTEWYGIPVETLSLISSSRIGRGTSTVLQYCHRRNLK